jgi:hypothetical protein
MCCAPRHPLESRSHINFCNNKIKFKKKERKNTRESLTKKEEKFYQKNEGGMRSSQRFLSDIPSLFTKFT